jgi:hypothetical protein
MVRHPYTQQRVPMYVSPWPGGLSSGKSLNASTLRLLRRHDAVSCTHNDAQHDGEGNTQQSFEVRHSRRPSSWSTPASRLRNPSPPIRRPNGGATAARKGNPGKSESNGDTTVRQAKAGSAAEGPSHASHLPYCLVAGLHISPHFAAVLTMASIE